MSRSGVKSAWMVGFALSIAFMPAAVAAERAANRIVEIPLFDSQLDRKPLPVPEERPSSALRISVSSYQPSGLVTETRIGQSAGKFQRKDLPMLRFESVFSFWQVGPKFTLSPVLGLSVLRLERTGVLSADAGGLRTEQNALLMTTFLGGEVRFEPIFQSRFNLFSQAGIQPSLFFSQRTAISTEQTQGAFPFFASLGTGIPVFFKTDLILAVESVFFSGGSSINLNGSGLSAGIQFRL